MHKALSSKQIALIEGEEKRGGEGKRERRGKGRRRRGRGEGREEGGEITVTK